MNEYKLAWRQGTYVGLQEDVVKRKRISRAASGQKNKSFAREVAEGTARNLGKEMAWGAAREATRWAARNQLSGRVGVALRIGGRIGVRAIPIVGWAMVAHDLYHLGKWAHEKL